MGLSEGLLSAVSGLCTPPMVSHLPSLDLPLVLSFCHNWNSFHLLRTDCESGSYLVPSTFYLIQFSQSLYKAGASIVPLYMSGHK